MYNNTLTLNNGAKIPQLGLGTWFIDDAKVADAVKEAVKLGYRHMIQHRHMAMKEVSVKECVIAEFQERNFL